MHSCLHLPNTAIAQRSQQRISSTYIRFIAYQTAPRHQQQHNDATVAGVCVEQLQSLTDSQILWLKDNYSYIS
jgi:hypothetical protein